MHCCLQLLTPSSPASGLRWPLPEAVSMASCIAGKAKGPSRRGRRGVKYYQIATHGLAQALLLTPNREAPQGSCWQQRSQYISHATLFCCRCLRVYQPGHQPTTICKPHPQRRCGRLVYNGREGAGGMPCHHFPLLGNCWCEVLLWVGPLSKVM